MSRAKESAVRATRALALLAAFAPHGAGAAEPPNALGGHESALAKPAAPVDPRFSGALGLTLLSSLFDDTGRWNIWEAESMADQVRPLQVTAEARLPGSWDSMWVVFRGSLGYARSHAEPLEGTEPGEVDGVSSHEADARTWRWGLRGGLRYCFDPTPTWHFSTYGLLGFDRRSRATRRETETETESGTEPSTQVTTELAQGITGTVGMVAERPLNAGFTFKFWFDVLEVRHMLLGTSTDLTGDEPMVKIGDQTGLGASLNVLAELAYAF